MMFGKRWFLRCHDKDDKGYKNYGGRGIEVWLDWREDFLEFYNWCQANGYKERAGLSLDRKDNDGNYSPQNCWFTDKPTQNRNRRSNRYFTAFGETKCLFDWGKDPRCKVSVWGLRTRVDKPEWEGRFEEALTVENDKPRADRNNKRTIQLTAFGETKCMSAWLEDKRCLVKIDSLRDRLRKGWDATKAISTPPSRDGKNSK